MTAFGVYGTDLTKAIAEFDTINEAIEYARKGLRNNGHGRTIKSRKYKSVWYTAHKINGEVIVKRHEKP